jgi:transcriptional regulator with XRE-family HTH domain
MPRTTPRLSGARTPATNIRVIYSLLTLHGLTCVSIARELGVSRQAVALVIRGARRSERIRRHLAARLGEQVLALIPATRKERTA